MARLSGLQSAAATRTENAGGSASAVIQLFLENRENEGKFAVRFRK